MLMAYVVHHDDQFHLCMYLHFHRLNLSIVQNAVLISLSPTITGLCWFNKATKFEIGDNELIKQLNVMSKQGLAVTCKVMRFVHSQDGSRLTFRTMAG